MIRPPARRRAPHILAVLMAAALLTACAGQLAHRAGIGLIQEGKPEQGLSKLLEASRADPVNAEFRLRFLHERELFINRILSEADQYRAAERLDEAEAAYRRLLSVDPSHLQGMRGLASVDLARRVGALLAEARSLLAASDLAAARERVAQMQLLDPDHPKVRLLARELDERAQRIQARPSLNENLAKTVTLEFQSASFRQVMEALDRYSGLNFLIDSSVPQPLPTTLSLKRVSVADALDVVLSLHQLEKAVLNDNTFLIYPNTAVKQAEHQELLIKSFYLANAEAKQVAATLKTLLKIKSVSIDEKLNLLIMRDTPTAVRLAEKLVALQDVPEPEVMLEVEVLEIKRTRLTQLGVQFPSQLSLAPLPVDGSVLTVADLKNLDSTRVGATLAATTLNLRRDVGDIAILANPRIRARSKEKASIKIGDRVPVITTTSSATGFVGDSVQYVDVGLKLEVEPTVFRDGGVAIKLALEVSSVVNQITTKSGTLAYQIGGRNASTVLRLNDGETQILGGLINDEDRRTANRLPGLGDLPLLGRLFSNQTDDTAKTELVLSITPRIIRGLVPPQYVPGEFWSGTENHLRLERLAPNTKSTAVPRAGMLQDSAGQAPSGAVERPPQTQSPARPSEAPWVPPVPAVPMLKQPQVPQPPLPSASGIGPSGG